MCSSSPVILECIFICPYVFSAFFTPCYISRPLVKHTANIYGNTAPISEPVTVYLSQYASTNQTQCAFYVLPIHPPFNLYKLVGVMCCTFIACEHHFRGNPVAFNIFSGYLMQPCIQIPA